MAPAVYRLGQIPRTGDSFHQDEVHPAGPIYFNLNWRAPRLSFPIFFFPDFIFSYPCLSPQSCSHPDPIRGQKCLGTIRTNLTTDVTDTIWIKDKRLIPSFPIFFFPDFIFFRHRPDLPT
jgi:hypothetical protein